MNSEKILVRGVPVSIEDIKVVQDNFGVQLFDESVFEADFQKTACANILVELDRKVFEWQVKNKTGELPDALDIGDKSWIYLPIYIFNPSQVNPLPTPDHPAGLLAWFRAKKGWRVQKRQSSPSWSGSNGNVK